MKREPSTHRRLDPLNPHSPARGENLLRLLRNAAAADISHPMGPIAITGGYVAAVENTAPSASCSVSTGGSSATDQQYRRQRPWSLVPRSGQSPLRGAFQCLL